VERGLRLRGLILLPMGTTMSGESTGTALTATACQSMGEQSKRDAVRTEVSATGPGTLRPVLRRREHVKPGSNVRRPRGPLQVMRSWLFAKRGPVLGGGSSRVTFVGNVVVNTYSRRLGGGDGVPTDGSTVALGLGTAIGVAKARLAAGPRAESDQISWMPPEAREKALEDAMGADVFARSRAQQMPDLAQLLERRKLSTQDGKDVMLMPQSLLEAQTRAAELSAEVKADRAEQFKATALRRLSMPASPRKKPQGTSSAAAAKPKAARFKLAGKAAMRMKATRKISKQSFSSKVRKHLKAPRQNLKQNTLSKEVLCTPTLC